MAIYYPQLPNGIITQKPYTSGVSFSTILQEVESGRPYSFPQIGAGLTNFPTNPLGKFSLNYPLITDAEIATLLTFFRDTAEGRLNEFIFLDPGGNLVPFSEDFSNASWTRTSVSVGAAQIDPFGGALAVILTATSSDSKMSAIVVPAGGASGFILTASIWVRAASAGQSLQLGFTDSGFSVIGSQIFALPQNIWTRIVYSITLATSSSIRVQVGGSSTWNGTTINTFGAQCVASPGPGAYRKTPGSDGLHAKCRFDVDEFEYKQSGINQNALVLPVSEYF